ncbi:GNAT family N-acetyltransferase [Aneurinibacillus sp. REN35]|uniref:GNAT family N-acetyltransferase n=1 Tax=Aneurinibacillus sp. REN35 TaxID=3237286 RepID=UPI00352901DF
MSGPSIYLRLIEEADTEAILDLCLRNRSFLQPFEPIRPDTYFTIAGQRILIEEAVARQKAGIGYSFGIYLASEDTLIGRLSISNIVRGAWENGTVGYFIDQACNGRGYMTEALRCAIRFAFEEAKLHRLQAAVMPHNQASIRVIEKNGFLYEGLAKYYLRIHGVWEDHLIYALTQENWSE